LGHIAIVESIRWSTKYNKSWIRVIEAQGKDTGVRYSSLDDTRLSSHNAFIYRVVIKKDFSNYQSRFEHFIHQQWHKEYELRYLGTTKKTSINSDSWYCSELAWAAWLYIGYDIERPSSFLNWSDPGVTPLDIVRDNKNKVYKLC
jgi:uncharacterized protein YycO